MKAKYLNIKRTTWPQLILVAKRTAKVKGRIKTPIISNKGMKIFNNPSIPSGKKCLIIKTTLLTIHKTHLNKTKNKEKIKIYPYSMDNPTL